MKFLFVHPLAVLNEQTQENSEWLNPCRVETMKIHNASKVLRDMLGYFPMEDDLNSTPR